MTLMSRFVLVNQQPNAGPMYSDSQMNEFTCETKALQPEQCRLIPVQQTLMSWSFLLNQQE